MFPDALDAETRAFLLQEARLQTFLDRLLATKLRVVRWDTLWATFTESYRDLPSGAERRLWLALVLDTLAQRGDILLPVTHGKQWDRTSAVHLPTAVTLTALQANVASKSDWRDFPWHPQLAWIYAMRAMLQDQVSFLKQVHAGLVSGWFRDPECFKYRSLQLTGDEKRLEELQRGVLFGPARLTLELLGCEPESLPLASERFSAAPTLLIFENAAPFMLACRVLRGSGSAAFGRIAYGAGKQVLKAVRYLPLLEPVIGAIEYVGDLDAEGLSIAAELQRLSQLPVEPASSFHQAMLDSAVALGSPDGWPLSEGIEHVDLAKGISFLSSDLHERVGNIVRSGRRIPEEALSCAAMTRLLIQPGSSDA